jgi:hypothetical protein
LKIVVKDNKNRKGSDSDDEKKTGIEKLKELKRNKQIDDIWAQM